MPTFVLDDANQVLRLPKTPLTITVSSTGGAAHIEVVGGAPLEGLIRPAGHLVVVPGVNERTVVLVRPGSGDRFPTPTTLALTVEARAGVSADPERVQLNAADVSGLATHEVLVLEPTAHHVEVRLVTKVEDEVLPGLAQSARAAGRTLLGSDLAPDAERRAVAVALDPSASMRLVPEPTLRAVLDVLVGVSRLIGPSTFGLFGHDPVASGTTPSDVPELVRATLSSAPRTVGVRWADGAAWRQLTRGRALVYLVTDAVPADLDALEDAVKAADALAHVVLLGSDGRRPGRWREHVTASVVPVDHAADLTAFWLDRPDHLSDVVRALLHGHVTIAGVDAPRKDSL